MRYLFFLLFLVFTHICMANMASPVHRGTLGSTAFSSREIDILNEKILITPDQNFKTAAYQIQYFILAEHAGKQIPLLFYARDYKGDFKVWVDGIEVNLLEIPDHFIHADSPFQQFSKAFKNRGNYASEATTVEIQWDETSVNPYLLKDLKYFEVSLAKGEHEIRVEYVAHAWTDASSWIKEFSFRYSLSPARYWKSFHTLEVTLDASRSSKKLTSNLGKPLVTPAAKTVWTFDRIPVNCIQVNYVPETTAFASKLIGFGPVNMAYTFGIILLLIHFRFIYLFRKVLPEKKRSWVLVAGSILFPFLIILFFIYSFHLIDFFIGKDAGNSHGYVFMYIILYPLLVPVYFFIAWFFDVWAKKTSHRRREKIQH